MLRAKPDQILAKQNGIQGAHLNNTDGQVHYLDRHRLECALSRYGHTEEAGGSLEEADDLRRCRPPLYDSIIITPWDDLWQQSADQNAAKQLPESCL